MIRNSLILLPLSFLLAGFCSCSKDDDKDSIPGYVDLGLSVKWATFNVGASQPEEFGEFYSWGETSEKNVYEWSTYSFFKKAVTLSGQTVPRDSIKVTKYCFNSEKGYREFVDSIAVLEPADDVATVRLGGNWRMPTEQEFQELIDSCTWTWTTLNDVEGCLVTSNVKGFTDCSIFLPAAGYKGSKAYFENRGYYWTSSVNEDDPDTAFGMIFYMQKKNQKTVLSNDISCDGSRYLGRPVRAVCP